MTITTGITESGAVSCVTVIDGRRYKGRFFCSKREACKRFRARVAVAEQKLMKAKRQELIDACLNCQAPAEQCRGNCKFVKEIKLKRGKGIK